MKRLLLLLLALTVLKAKSQQRPGTALNAIREDLSRLEQNKKILFIGLFPGDEDARLLTVMREKYHYHTGFLMLCRGEAMPNFSGTEKGVDLGIIHAAEMEAAAKKGGFDLFATACRDIGARDSMVLSQVWNRNRLVADMATVIRKYRPDIIVTGHRGGNGEEALNSWLQALCRQTNQVAGAAEDSLLTDPTVVIQGAHYQAPYLLMETTDTVTDPSLLKIPMTGYDSVSGRQYKELAMQLKREERSLFADLDQIDLGADTGYFKLLEGSGLPDLDADAGYGAWSRLPQGPEMQAQISSLLDQLQSNNSPVKLLPALKKLYQRVQADKTNNPDQNSVLIQLKSLLLACAGIRIQASTDRDLGVLGQDFNLRIMLQNPLLPVQISQISIPGLRDSIFTDPHPLQLREQEGLIFEQKLHLRLLQQAYQPFWLNQPFNNDGSYQIDQAMQGRLLDSACFQAKVSFTLDSMPLEVAVPVRFRQFSRLEGVVSRPFYTVEPVLLTLTPDVLLIHIEGDTKPFKKPRLTLKLKTLFKDSSVLASFKIRQVGLEAAVQGQTIKTGAAQDLYKEVTYLSAEPGQSMHVDLLFDSSLSGKWRPETPFLKPEVILKLTQGTQAFSSNIKSVGYNYQSSTIYNYHSQTIVVADTVRTKGTRIAYVGGRPEDAIENALHQLGYRLTDMTADDLLKIILPENAQDSVIADYVTDSLRNFDAIILSGRSEDGLPDEVTIRRLQLLLKAYVEKGGVLLNLNADQQWLPALPANDFVRPEILLSDQRYTEITADQGATLFNFPNKIAVSNFADWTGLMATGSIGLDSAIACPVKLHVLADGRDAYPVSVHKLGAGVFVNCFLDLPSQLSSGRSFSYKFLANLIAVAHKGIPEKNEENNRSSKKTAKSNLD